MQGREDERRVGRESQGAWIKLKVGWGVSKGFRGADKACATLWMALLSLCHYTLEGCVAVHKHGHSSTDFQPTRQIPDLTSPVSLAAGGQEITYVVRNSLPSFLPLFIFCGPSPFLHVSGCSSFFREATGSGDGG
jgi:hypothetical protein